MNDLRSFLILVLKATLMGTGNIIPGVSGGTIALILNIYTDLIEALRRLNFKALKLLFTGRFSSFLYYIRGRFLLAFIMGIAISVLVIAQAFEYLFDHYPVFIWSLFFGLILGSVYFIGKRVKNWTPGNRAWIVIGTLASITLAFLPQAQENSAWWYVLICGGVSISGMTLPGISGSFLLILMGNYELLLIRSVTSFDVPMLSLFIGGSVLGLVGLSNILAWVLKRYHDSTMALLTGFVLGSLLIIWPWQEPVRTTLNAEGHVVVLEYARYWPDFGLVHTWSAVGIMLLGLGLIFGLEFYANRQES